MKINILDIKGNQIEEMTLDKSIFGLEPNNVLMAQYLRVFQTNQRQGTSSTLTRGEVSGGGKKPWKQKGTGRARVGSSRNPVWRHGGISHGPQPKDWNLSLPKKMRIKAIKIALSVKYAKNKMVVLNELTIKEPKSKLLAEVLTTLKLRGKTLLVLDTNDSTILKCAANIKNLKVAQAANLNGFEVLNANKIVFSKAAIKNLETKYKTK